MLLNNSKLSPGYTTFESEYAKVTVVLLSLQIKRADLISWHICTPHGGRERGRRESKEREHDDAGKIVLNPTVVELLTWCAPFFLYSHFLHENNQSTGSEHTLCYELAAYEPISSECPPPPE